MRAMNSPDCLHNRRSPKPARFLVVIFGLALALSLAPGAAEVSRAAKAQLYLSGISRPSHVAAPIGDGRVFVSSLSGLIQVRMPDGSVKDYLDLTDRVYEGAEEGLFHFLFDPDFSVNGYMYVYYVHDSDRVAYWSRFSASLADPNQADKNTEEVFYVFPRDWISNRNGGVGAFSPIDGYFYFSTGDNKDRDSAQSLSSPFGKMMRIDLRNPDSANGLLYSIPPSNPFRSVSSALPEVFARGLRNPWRWSFDDNGDVYIGDVGHNNFEELDFVTHSGLRGANFGWPLMEAMTCFPLQNECDTSGSELTLPVFTIPHNSGPMIGASITGGVVYHGAALPELQNRYIFTDFIYGWVKTFPAGDFSSAPEDITAELAFPSQPFPPSVGVDGYGELYIADIVGNVVYKLVPDAPFSADCNGNFQEDTLDLLYGFSKDCNTNGLPDECEPDENGDGIPDDCLTCCVVPGDADENGRISITDITFLVANIFAGGAAPTCQDQADANGDNSLNIGDVTYLIGLIFFGGSPAVCGATGA